jgi:hypothetical protein
MENDRFDVLEQLGWPIREHLPDSSYYGRLQQHHGTGVKVLQLTEHHQQAILAAPNALNVPADMTELEKKNVQLLYRWDQLIHEHGLGTPEARLAEIKSISAPNASLWVKGFESKNLVDYAIECESLVEAAPNMKLVSQNGFAKGELVFQTFSVSATISRGPLPLDQSPANSPGVFTSHAYAIVREGKIHAYWAVWNKGMLIGPLGQLGVQCPAEAVEAPYVPPAKILAHMTGTAAAPSAVLHKVSTAIEIPQPVPLQVGVNILAPSSGYTVTEKRNISTIQNFLYAFVRPSTIESSHRYVAPGATYVCSSFPAIHSVAAYIERQQLTSDTIPDMHIIGVDFIIAKGPYIAAMVEVAGSNLGQAPRGQNRKKKTNPLIDTDIECIHSHELCFFFSFSLCIQV